MSNIESSGKPQPAALSDDLLWGAQAIADEIGLSLDQVYHLIRMKRLPVTKLGPKTIIASRKRLRRVLSANPD